MATKQSQPIGIELAKRRIITEDDLKKRYLSMTRNPFIRFVIRHTFDEIPHFIV